MYVEIPTRTSGDPNSAADINQLQENIRVANKPDKFSLSKVLSVKTKTFCLNIHRSGTIAHVFAELQVAATGADVKFDIKKNGVSIFTSERTISAGSTARTDFASGLDSSQISVVAGDILQLDITQIGSTVPGGGWSFWEIWY